MDLKKKETGFLRAIFEGDWGHLDTEIPNEALGTDGTLHFEAITLPPQSTRTKKKPSTKKRPAGADGSPDKINGAFRLAIRKSHNDSCTIEIRTVGKDKLQLLSVSKSKVAVHQTPFGVCNTLMAKFMEEHRQCEIIPKEVRTCKELKPEFVEELRLKFGSWRTAATKEKADVD